MGKIKLTKVSEALKNKAQPHTNPIRSSLSDDTIGEFYYVDVEKVIPYRHQPRVLFEEDELHALAETIQKHGVRQPLTVILNSEGAYEVVSGERRLRASKLAGLKKVPCIIIQDEGQAEELSLIENMQRADLHPIEIASSLKKLLEKGYTQKEISEKLALRKSYVSETLKLEDLSPETKDFLVKNKITSREVMRDLLSGKQDLSGLKKQLNLSAQGGYARSKSVFRVGLLNGEYQIQKGSLSKLTEEQKRKLKHELTLIIKDYLSS